LVNPDGPEAAALITSLAERNKRLEEAIRSMLVEAHETIPPDGKEAAFHALGQIARIGTAALSPPTSEGDKE
jgi:hypothetical protein